MKILDHEIHPLCELFPFMDVKTFDALKTDMKTYGQRDTVKVFKDLVLDGKNRLKACRELNITPKIEILPEDTDIIAYVKASGLCRRDLTSFQRVIIAKKIDNYKIEMEGTKEKRDDLIKQGQGVIMKEKEIIRITNEANTNRITTEQILDIIEEAEKGNKDAEKEISKLEKKKTTPKKAHERIFEPDIKEKPKKPLQPKKSEVIKDYRELKINYEYLLERHQELINILQQNGSWDELKTRIYPIAETKKAPIYTIQQLREAGQI